MSRAAKLKRHGTVVRISGQYNQPWRGFTLQLGHLYGEDEKGFFVSAARPGWSPGTIQIYRCNTSSGDYVWHQTAESVDTETAKKIIQAAGDCGGKVTYEPVNKQVKRIYNPRLTTGRFRPMPHMMIPGGGWGGHETNGIVMEQAKQA